MKAWLRSVRITALDGGGRAALTVEGRRLLVNPAGTDPKPYRALTGRRHPEIRRIRALYRRKRGKHGWSR